MTRAAAGQSSMTVLREALAGPFPPLRAEALRIIRSALNEGPSVAAAARRLGIPRGSFERLREADPEIDQAVVDFLNSGL